MNKAIWFSVNNEPFDSNSTINPNFLSEECVPNSIFDEIGENKDKILMIISNLTTEEQELLYKLKNECVLKTLAIQEKIKEYEQKESKFIEFFSHASRIKRNMELRNLIEALNRSKLTIKTINYQINNQLW